MRFPSRSRLVRAALELGVAIALFAAVGFWRTRDHQRGAPPATKLPSLDGSPVSLAEPGKPTLVVFFAPWCGVCKLTAQNVRWTAAASDARVVSVATAYDDVDVVRAYAADHQLPGTVLLDASGATARAFGVTAFPTFYFLDADGRISGSTVGYTTTAGLLARLWL